MGCRSPIGGLTDQGSVKKYLTAAARLRPLAAGWRYASRMCRNIRPLHNFQPPAGHEEIRDAALQYVRKISGSTKPSQANAQAFEQAVDDVALATTRLLDRLVTSAPPKNREVEAAKRRARAAERFAA
jgi:hypothetical protein